MDGWVGGFKVVAKNLAGLLSTILIQKLQNRTKGKKKGYLGIELLKLVLEGCKLQEYLS